MCDYISYYLSKLLGKLCYYVVFNVYHVCDFNEGTCDFLYAEI